jgi:hypothetical protein
MEGIDFGVYEFVICVSLKRIDLDAMEYLMVYPVNISPVE